MPFLWNSLRLIFALTVAFLAHPFFQLRATLRGDAKNGAWQKEWLRWGSAWALRILHVKVESRGQIPKGGLLVSNHQGVPRHPLPECALHLSVCGEGGDQVVAVVRPV